MILLPSSLFCIFTHFQHSLSLSQKVPAMDDYLQYMKTLRSQMNDVEDQAAKVSVEEQMRLTIIHTLEKDLHSAKSETKRFKEDIEQMIKAQGHICSQILEKQRKIASLESDSSTLSQTLELMQQERITASAKLTDKRTYYAKVTEDISAKLQEQQAWVNSHRPPEDRVDTLDDKAMKNLMTNLGSAKEKLDEITDMKYKLVSEKSKMRQSIEQAGQRTNDFKPELRAMDLKTLEEEQKVLLLDKAGETEYMQSLQDQIGKLKGISHVIKCGCGEEYKVGVNPCA